MIYSLLNDISWVVNIRTPYLTPIFEFFTWLGYRDFLFMFIPFIYWCYDRKVFGKLLVIVFFSAIINSFLKDIFQDPRPDFALNIDPWLQTDTSFGFPSGHTQIAVVIWLYIALNVKNLFVKSLSIIFLFGVPLSRVYLGVHDIGDILGGLVVGLATLYISDLIYKNIERENIKFNAFTKYLSLVVIFLLFYLTWPTAHGNEAAIAIGGLMIGFFIGKDIDYKQFNFVRTSNAFAHYTSCFLALFLFLLFNEFLNLAFEKVNLPIELETALSSLILGFFISFLSLYLLSKIKLQLSK